MNKSPFIPIHQVNNRPISKGYEFLSKYNQVSLQKPQYQIPLKNNLPINTKINK